MDEKKLIEGWAWLLKLVAGAMGAVSLLILVVTWLGEAQLRAAAHDYIVREVTNRVEEKLGQEMGGFAQAASLLSKFVDSESEGIPERIKTVVPPLVSKWLAEHCEGEFTATDAQLIEDAAAEVAVGLSGPLVAMLKKRAESLRDFAEGYYDKRWEALIRELRIFSFSNAALALFSFLLLHFRPLHADLVVGPLSLLTLANVVAIYFWFSGQDWLWTILTSSYMGWGYLALVGICFLVLAYAASGWDTVK